MSSTRMFYIDMFLCSSLFSIHRRYPQQDLMWRSSLESSLSLWMCHSNYLILIDSISIIRETLIYISMWFVQLSWIDVLFQETHDVNEVHVCLILIWIKTSLTEQNTDWTFSDEWSKYPQYLPIVQSTSWQSKHNLSRHRTITSFCSFGTSSRSHECANTRIAEEKEEKRISHLKDKIRPIRKTNFSHVVRCHVKRLNVHNVRSAHFITSFDCLIDPINVTLRWRR